MPRIRLGLVGLLSLIALAALALLAPPDGNERGDLAQFIGGFHPLAVHLPIAFLLLVPVLEIAGRHPRYASLRAAADFVLALAVLSALATPCLGWLLAWSAGFEGTFVTQHMWGGIAVAATALLSWILRARAFTAPPGTAMYAGALTLTVLTVAFTGYRGGQLAHGEHHLTEHLPASVKAWLGVSAAGAPALHTFYGARIAPLFEEHCVLCHSAAKHKGGLRLDSYEGLIAGGEHGAVVVAGNARTSELFRRVSLDPAHKDFMPAEGKPALGEEERVLLELWINAGASATIASDAVADAPAMKQAAEPLAPDYRPAQATIAQLESSLGMRLVPRSQNPTDGLILRTASDPAACTDAALAKLAPVARYIVDAELARTKLTDAGLASLAQFSNLRSLDLSHTAVSSAGVAELTRLRRLERLNLTGTEVDETAVLSLRQSKRLERLYLFQTKAAEPDQNR